MVEVDMSMRIGARSATALLAGGSLLVSCGGGGGGGGITDPSENGSAVEVRATDGLTFQPANVTIAPGASVRWRRTSSLVHTVTPNGHQQWQEVVLASNGQSFQHTFPTAGVFPYVCTIHPGMSGSVTVQAGNPGAGGGPGGGGGGDGGGVPGDPDYPG